MNYIIKVQGYWSIGVDTLRD